MKETTYEYKPVVDPPVRTVDGVSGTALVRIEKMIAERKKLVAKLRRDKKDRDTVITMEPSVASHLDGQSRVLFLKLLDKEGLFVARVKATPQEKVDFDMPTRKGDVYFTYISTSNKLVKAAKQKKRKEQNAGGGSKTGSEAGSSPDTEDEDEEDEDENEDEDEDEDGVSCIDTIQESIKENEDALKTGNDELCLTFPPHRDFALKPLELLELQRFVDKLGLCLKFLEATAAESLKEGNKSTLAAYHIFVANVRAAATNAHDIVVADRPEPKRKRVLLDVTNIEGGNKKQSK